MDDEAIFYLVQYHEHQTCQNVPKIQSVKYSSDESLYMILFFVMSDQ